MRVRGLDFRRAAAALAISIIALGFYHPIVVHAGGTPENAFVLVDPSDLDALYVANHYVSARNIPAQNVLYIDPGAADYAGFVDYNLDALLGTLANRELTDHIDYIVVAPSNFYLSASNLITDQCWPVNRFAISSCYTMAHIADTVSAGGLPSTYSNEYYDIGTARGFDSETAWNNGAPSGSPTAPRYFIGTLLGYLGERGNTAAEIIAMIDRSVAVDGTQPTGTFYFMNNPADPARNVRSPQYNGAVGNILLQGGAAEIIGTVSEPAVLPLGRHDCLGIMTGDDWISILSADMTILSGAFCDHLTSNAGEFDNANQTKLSNWIGKGASGSWGAVEEPCNYTGKFPNARLHALYFAGLSLGEAALRSASFVPFQMLLYGDPLTRPWAHLPSVSVPDAPTGVVSGTITLTPQATTTHPTASIDRFDLLIDGRLHSTVLPAETFSVDTTLLPDGWHDVRVLAYDDTLVASVGRWIGEMTVDNLGRNVSLNASPSTGFLATAFTFNVNGVRADVEEVRLLQNGRVVAAAESASAALTVYGVTFGRGLIRVQAEAVYYDGTVARSAPADIEVTNFTGTPVAAAPTAYSFTKFVRKDAPFVVELPGTLDDPNEPLTYTVLTPPTQTDVPADQTGPYRLMHPQPGASRQDSFTYQVSTDGSALSEIATVTLIYDWWQIGDTDCDGEVGFGDINPFVRAIIDQADYEERYPHCVHDNADINQNGTVGFDDINPFVDLLIGKVYP